MGTRAGRAGLLPWGLIGALVLVGAVERTVARHEWTLTSSPTALAWRAARKAAGREARSAEILCLGDSLVKLGVLPRVIEARTGRSAYNLATDSSPAPAAYFLLRRALAAGARPRVLLVDFHSQVLPTPPRDSLPYWPELLGVGEAVELGWIARDSGFVTSTLLATLLPSLKDRDGLRTTFLGRDRRALEGLLGAHVRNWRSNGGATVYQKIPPPAREPIQVPLRGTWTPARPNLHYVRRFLDLAAARNIPVFWLLPPLTPGRQRKLEREGQDERFTRLLRDLQAADPNLHVIDGRRSGYPRAVFIDQTHLDRDGAAEFSAEVAALIGPRLRGSSPDERWLQLPSYTGQRIDTPLEDLQQSRLAREAAPAVSRR